MRDIGRPGLFQHNQPKADFAVDCFQVQKIKIFRIRHVSFGPGRTNVACFRSFQELLVTPASAVTASDTTSPPTQDISCHPIYGSIFENAAMSEKKKENKRSNRFLGTYTTADGQSVVGELRICGRNTLLKLHSDQPLSVAKSSDSIEGTAFTGERLTLIYCINPGVGTINRLGEPTRYNAEVFPHYVAVGRTSSQAKSTFCKGYSFHYC